MARERLNYDSWPLVCQSGLGFAHFLSRHLFVLICLIYHYSMLVTGNLKFRTGRGGGGDVAPFFCLGINLSFYDFSPILRRVYSLALWQCLKEFFHCYLGGQQQPPTSRVTSWPRAGSVSRSSAKGCSLLLFS